MVVGNGSGCDSQKHRRPLVGVGWTGDPVPEQPGVQRPTCVHVRLAVEGVFVRIRLAKSRKGDYRRHHAERKPGFEAGVHRSP